MGTGFGMMIIGIICGLAFAAVILKITKTDGRIKCKYDERQKAARGKAYMISFYVLLAYNFLYGSYAVTADHVIVDPFAAMLIGILLAIVVQVSYCIWHDAYFSLNEDKKKVMWAFGIIGVINFIPGILAITSGEMIKNGMLTMRCTNLLCGCLFIYIFVLYGCKLSSSKKQAKEDE